MVENEYVPIVNIEGVKKFPVYGTLMQEVNKNGMGELQLKIGYRNLVGWTDKLEVTYEQMASRHNYYRYGVTWKAPVNDTAEAGVTGEIGLLSLCEGMVQRTK